MTPPPILREEKERDPTSLTKLELARACDALRCLRSRQLMVAGFLLLELTKIDGVVMLEKGVVAIGIAIYD
ncbi:hypothetical protein VNO80_02584 [Phaseolus coccineus]|uniref:Uncharacterized protein n=1 Tax=Phaseolus coccineus TaxID=3886 RepID=A0AAN9RMH9_PHACN